MTVLPKLSNMASTTLKDLSYDPFVVKSSAFSFSQSQQIKSVHPFRAFRVRRMCGGSGDATATNERTEEEKERLKAEREQRKAAKEAEAAAKKARKEAEAKAKADAEAAEAAAMRVPVAYLSQQQPPERCFADYATVMSRSETGRRFSRVQDLGAAPAGSSVWIRARVAGVRGKGGSAPPATQPPCTTPAAAAHHQHPPDNTRLRSAAAASPRRAGVRMRRERRPPAARCAVASLCPKLPPPPLSHQDAPGI